MSVAGNPQSNLAVVPLGAGDLIDRAVRFYRKYFWTFIFIASPPVLVGTIVSVGWTFAGRQIFSIGADRYSVETTFYYIFLWFGSVVIWLTETVATLVVMGGASRNFVRHLLFGEAITFRETYRNSAKRLGGLIFASSLITVLLGSVGMAIFYFAAMVLLILIGLIIWAVGAIIPIVGFILSIVVALVVAGAAIWLFFLAASRLAYVPQVMLVEGQGVFFGDRAKCESCRRQRKTPCCFIHFFDRSRILSARPPLCSPRMVCVGKWRESDEFRRRHHSGLVRGRVQSDLAGKFYSALTGLDGRPLPVVCG